MKLLNLNQHQNENREFNFLNIDLRENKEDELNNPPNKKPRKTKLEILADWALEIKSSIQLGIGFFVVIYIILKLYEKRFLVTQLNFGFTSEILTGIGDILVISSAIELAYTLFTPGPDEAVEPLITGIAALILITTGAIHLGDPMRRILGYGLLIILLATVLFILFIIRRFFFNHNKKSGANEA